MVVPAKGFKDLIVWQKAYQLALGAYKACQALPRHETYGLGQQMQRSSVSIPSNIAEGYGRQATGEYHHHLSIARASLLELETQLLITERLNYIGREHLRGVLTEVDQISRMLASLIANIF